MEGHCYSRLENTKKQKQSSTGVDLGRPAVTQV